MNDVYHLILLELDYEDLKQLMVNKQFSKILNDDYFWCLWLKKHDYQVSTHCKYIATHINVNVDYMTNFYKAVKNEYIPVIKYYLDHRDKYEDIDLEYLYYYLTKYNKLDSLIALQDYQPQNMNILLYPLAYKQYDALKILLDHDQLLSDELKYTIISLINENKKYRFLSDENIKIEDEIDELFTPYIIDNEFAGWRGDFLY